MFIENLKLKNYRNHSDFSVDIEKGLNFIIGRNAAGKTNLLESIYFLETGRSHRVNNYHDVIKWGEPFSVIKAPVKRIDRDFALEATISRTDGKKLKINGVESRKLQLKTRPISTVVFTPDHLKIVKEMPENRRAYADEILEKIKPDYAYWKQQYSKILKQRNILLKKVYIGRMKKDVIDYWDNQLVEAGVKVVVARKSMIEKLQVYAEQAFQKITDSDVGFRLKYENQLLKAGIPLELLKERYQTELYSKRSLEIDRGQTLIGPHRDDIGIYEGDIDLRLFGSQGEQRSASLALKMAELSIISEHVKESPILLLDDVMSELDEFRRKALLKQIDTDTQAIITSTNAEFLRGIDVESPNIIRIS